MTDNQQMTNRDAGNNWAEQAMRLFSNQEINEAQNLCHKALSQNQDDDQALQLLGVMALHQGEFAEAEQYLDKAVQAVPDSAQAWANFGSALAMQGKSQEAETAYARALEKDPYYDQVYINQEVLFKDQGRYDEAASALNSAVEIRPSAEAFVCLAEILTAQERIDDAKTVVQAAANLQPTERETIADLIRMLSFLGFVEEAREWGRALEGDG